MADAPRQLTNRHHAEEAARRYAAACAQRDELKAYVADETEALVASVAGKLAEAEAVIADMGGLLTDYHARNLVVALGYDLDDPDQRDRIPTKAEWEALKTARTDKLTYATVSARRTPGAYEVTDPAALVEFLKAAAPELLRQVLGAKDDLVARLTVKTIDEPAVDEHGDPVIDPDTGEPVTHPVEVVLLDGERVPGVTPPRPVIKPDVKPVAAPKAPPPGVIRHVPAGFPEPPNPYTTPTNPYQEDEPRD